MERYFTEGTDGMENFMADMESKGLASWSDDGKWKTTFDDTTKGIEDAANSMGMSSETFLAMFDKIKETGGYADFFVDAEGGAETLGSLYGDLITAQTELNKLYTEDPKNKSAIKAKEEEISSLKERIDDASKSLSTLLDPNYIEEKNKEYKGTQKDVEKSLSAINNSSLWQNTNTSYGDKQRMWESTKAELSAAGLGDYISTAGLNKKGSLVMNMSESNERLDKYASVIKSNTDSNGKVVDSSKLLADLRTALPNFEKYIGKLSSDEEIQHFADNYNSGTWETSSTSQGNQEDNVQTIPEGISAVNEKMSSLVDALKSKNYVVGESGSFLNLADGSFDSKYLKWDNAGKVIANDITVVGGSINVNDKFIVNNDGIATLQGATVVGNITAESGKIGKFNLDNLALVTGDTDVTCAGLGGSSQAFWAGSLTMDDAPFRVGYDGSFYSSKGKIAGWEITSDSFYKDTDDYTVYVCPGTNNNKDFLTVHDKNKSSGDEWPFYVHADGWMHCVYGDIGGWNIGKNSINSSYSNTETTEYYVSDSFYSLSILSDSSKIISEFNEKKYSDSSKQKILSSESDSLTISGDSIQGTSRYILYGEETDKSGYSFLLSAYNGLEILDEVSEEGISYTGNHILFTRYNETVAEITEDKINSCHAGEVCHYYGNGYGDCGTNNNKYYDLSAFTTGGGKTFGSFHTKMSNEKIKINRTGVYCFQVRFSVNSGVNGSADKRVEFVPFVNNTRLPRYAASFSSRGNFSITNFQTYILSLNKGDVVAFDISPIEKVSVRVQIADIFVHVLDYVNKYADEYN